MSVPAVTASDRRTRVALRTNPRLERAVMLLLFSFGAALCFPYLFTSAFGPGIIVFLSLTWTLSSVVARHAWWRVLRWAALGYSTALYAVSAYGAVLFTAVLGWSLSLSAIALIAFTALGAIASTRRGWRGIRVPMVLPLGLLLTTVALGWWREGGRVRCDDYLRVRRQPGVEVIVPSLQELADCRPGAMLPLGRYPRQIWESPDRQTIVFTTQAEPFPGATDSGLGGAVCTARLTSGAAPHCNGAGKGDGITEVGPHGQLVALSSGGPDRKGKVYTLPLDRLFDEPAVAYVQTAGAGIYDPTIDVLYVFGVDGRIITPMRGEDLQASEEIPIPLPGLADYGHYEADRHEGIFCGSAGPLGAVFNEGRPYLAVGFRGLPLALRPFGGAMLGWVAISFGCDWDPATRRAYVAIPNLGAVAEIDYDTGQLIDLGRTDVGLRYLRFDARRRRLYAGDFLRGSIVELDADDKRQLRRWFVGRFARDVHPTRDGSALLAASNLGVLRIRL